MIGNKRIFRKEKYSYYYILWIIHFLNGTCGIGIEHFDIYYIETMAKQASSEYRFN